MNLYLHNFIYNLPKDINDIITSVSYDEHPSGIIRVRITTKDKYYVVNSDWSFNTPSYKGEGISFMPHLRDGDTYLNPYEDINLDSYYEHPDWWKLDLVLETDKYYLTRVIPLKHEYLWVLIPHDIVFAKYDKMTVMEIFSTVKE